MKAPRTNQMMPGRDYRTDGGGNPAPVTRAERAPKNEPPGAPADSDPKPQTGARHG